MSVRMMKGVKRIVCGMSGGVDSAVAALMLKKKGYEVVGLFMKNWDIRNEQGQCSSDEDLESAEFVCKNLSIPLHTVDFVKEYWNEVFSEMVSDYEAGITPNPDILCNRQIKFHHFFHHAISNFDADAIATGHYAQTSAGYDILRDNFLGTNKGVDLLCAEDTVKDQTFFLSQISQWALQRSLFPIGHLHKAQVKNIAAQAGMERIAKKKESMGICFIGSRNFHDFIEDYIPPRPGPFIDVETGDVVGTHKGTHYWTLGQRCHLGGKAKAYFVCEVRPDTKHVIVAPGTDHPALFTQSFDTGEFHWIRSTCPSTSNTADCSHFEADFRFQHKHQLIPCQINLHQPSTDNHEHSNSKQLLKLKQRSSIKLSQPMRAVTPGQFAVFYRDGICLGSARIVSLGPTLYDLDECEKVFFPKEFS